MTRIPSLLLASAVAILPLSAFAQQTAAPGKTAGPTSVATQDKPTTAAPSKAETKTQASGSRTDAHGMTTTTTGHAKPAKTAEPSKS